MRRDLQDELKNNKDFRVVIFGSARIKKGDERYREIKSLAKMLGEHGIDVVTGGGPGLMMAANEGHRQGKKGKNKSHSIGLNIKLPREQKANKSLDITKTFSRFSNRLDSFMLLSNVIVVAPGGVGTLLEFLYSWQLIQVKHTCHIPIILLGKQWPPLIKWVEQYPLKNKFLNKEDMSSLFLAKNTKEAMKMIETAHKEFKSGNKKFCLNYKKYKLY